MHSPATTGIDFSTKGELIAASKSVDEIRDFVGLDSLGYLPIDSLKKATAIPDQDLCFACFKNGEYPVPIEKETSKFLPRVRRPDFGPKTAEREIPCR